MIRKLMLLMMIAPVVVQAQTIELARVNGETIDEKDLEAAFVGKHGGHTAFLGGEVEARRFLEIVIDERLLIQEAYALGLDQDPEVKPQVDEVRDRKRSDHLAKMEIEAKAEPSEEDIRAAWVRAKDLYVAREIVLDTEQEAEEIRVALLGGADAEELARRCSIGRTRSRGGAMTAFTWGSLTPEIENAAAAMLPGEVSPVIRGPEGWTVLVLLNRLEAERPDLDDRISQRIAAKLRERKIEDLTEAFAGFLWKEYAAELVIEELSALALTRLHRNSPDVPVARWNGGELKVREAVTPEELKMYAVLPPGRAAAQIEETLRSAVNTQLIRLEAAKRGIDELPEVAEAIDRFEAGLVERALYAKHVLKNVTVTDEDVRAAYEDRRDELTMPEKRRVAHIAVATEDEAKELYERIERGEDFDELLPVHTLDTATAKSGGDLGWIEKGKVATIYDPIFELALGGVAPPIASETAWHLVRVTAIEAPHLLSYEEAKEKLHTQLLEKKKHDARKYWIEKLREASEIEILDQGIRAFVEANPFEAPPEMNGGM